MHQFSTEKQQLEAKLNQKLSQEIQAARAAISQAVAMVRIEQTKNFEKLVSEKLNEERNGRLANLEKLNDRIVELEKFAEGFETNCVQS